MTDLVSFEPLGSKLILNKVWTHNIKFLRMDSLLGPAIKNKRIPSYKCSIPESTTKRTPSIVTEVSAILVEMIHFLTPGGAMSNT